jgi:hypothetical protein
VFHALFGAGEDDSSAAGVIAGLRHHRFGDLDEQRVVQSLLALRGGDVARDLHDEFDKDERRSDAFDDTERALELTISFLRRQGVPHLQLVPSTFPVPVLAAFFHLHPDPDPWTERLLARWLWRGWVHGYGRSGQTPALRQAVRAVNPTKGDRTGAPSEYEAVAGLLAAVPDEPVPAIELESFRTNFASGRLALLALASLGPLTVTGQPIDLPQALDEDGVEAIVEIVQGHRTELAARAFWPRNSPSPDGREPDAVLASHSISAEAAERLKHGDVNGFLRLRRTTLEPLVTGFLQGRTDPGAKTRPPLATLFVPDD